MLIGEYNHSIDAKKRLSVPAKMRKELGERAVITRGLDGCLFLFPMIEWQDLTTKLKQLPLGQQDTRGFVRLMLSGAVEVELDSLGRILIPDYLRDYAGLRKSAVITGLASRAEIWDEAKWKDYKKELEKNGDKIAEKLGEMGVV